VKENFLTKVLKKVTLRTKKVLEKNKNIKFKEKTENGTLIFEGKHKRLGITKEGEIIR